MDTIRQKVYYVGYGPLLLEPAREDLISHSLALECSSLSIILDVLQTNHPRVIPNQNIPTVLTVITAYNNVPHKKKDFVLKTLQPF